MGGSSSDSNPLENKQLNGFANKMNRTFGKEVRMKLIMAIILIILFISLFNNIQYYKLLKNEQHNEQVYLKNTGERIYALIQDIEVLKEAYIKEDFSELDLNLNNLCNQLNGLEEYMRQSVFCIDNKINMSEIMNISVIENGIQGALGKGYQKGFADDKILTENEYKFLDKLANDLHTLLGPIYDIKKLDINKNIKLTDFTESLDIFNNWYIEARITTNGTTPFDLLKSN